MPTYSNLFGIMAEDRIKKAETQVAATREDARVLLDRAGITPDDVEAKAVSKLARAYESRKLFRECHKLRALQDAMAELYSARQSFEVWKGRLDAQKPRTEAPRLKTAPKTVADFDVAIGEASGRLDRSKDQSNRLGEEIMPILVAAGRNVHHLAWTQTQLRMLVADLHRDESPDEARAIERYADGRLDVKRAMGSVNRLINMRQGAEKRERKTEQAAARSRASQSPAGLVYVDPATSQAIPVQAIATPADKAPIRLAGPRANGRRANPPWESGPAS